MEENNDIGKKLNNLTKFNLQRAIFSPSNFYHSIHYNFLKQRNSEFTQTFQWVLIENKDPYQHGR